MTYKEYLLHEVALVDKSVGNGTVPQRFKNTELESIERSNETLFRMQCASAFRQISAREAAKSMTL